MTFLNQGFTLVELLVTVVILGILASTSVAQFEEYRQKTYHSESLIIKKMLQDMTYAAETTVLEGAINKNIQAYAVCYAGFGYAGVKACFNQNHSSPNILSSLLPDTIVSNNNMLISVFVARNGNGSQGMSGLTTSTVSVTHCKLKQPNSYQWTVRTLTIPVTTESQYYGIYCSS